MSEAANPRQTKNVLQKPRKNWLVRILKPWKINLCLLKSKVVYAVFTFVALLVSFIAESCLFLLYFICINKRSQPKTCPAECTSENWLWLQMVIWIIAKSLSFISILLLLNYLNVEIEIIGKKKAGKKIIAFLLLSFLFIFSLVKWIYWSSLVIAILQAANIIAVVYGTFITNQSSQERERYDNAFKLSEWKKEDLAPIYDYQNLEEICPSLYDLRPVYIEDKLYLMKPMTLTANDKDWIKEMLAWENYNFLRFEAFVVEFIELPYLEIAFEIQGILMEYPENGNIYSKIKHSIGKAHIDKDFLDKAFQPLTNCVGVLIWISQLANALEYCHYVLGTRPVIETDRLFLTDNYCKLAIDIFEQKEKNTEAGDISKKRRKIALINGFVNVVKEIHEKLEAAKKTIIQQLVKSEDNANEGTEERTSQKVEESLNFLKNTIQQLTKKQEDDKPLEIFGISAFFEAKIYNIKIEKRRENKKKDEKKDNLEFVQNQISGYCTKSLIREKKAVLEIKHENIRKFISFVYDSNPLKIEGYYFERFSDSTLEKSIIETYPSIAEDKKGRFNKYLLQIANQIRAAIDACHEKNIIHRNICPDAILIHEEIYDSDELHKTPIVKLKDFSSARIVGQLMTASSEPKAYCAPEMIKTDGGEYVHYDYRVDYWSYAFVLYFLVNKKEPTGKIHKQTRINYPPIDDELYESLREVKADILKSRMESCWNEDPTKRNITDLDDCFLKPSLSIAKLQLE